VRKDVWAREPTVLHLAELERMIQGEATNVFLQVAYTREATGLTLAGNNANFLKYSIVSMVVSFTTVVLYPEGAWSWQSQKSNFPISKHSVQRRRNLR